MNHKTRQTRLRAIEDLTFVCPPECGGQIVEYSYAADENYIYERRDDRSARSPAKIAAYHHPAGEAEFASFAPWNGTPRLGAEAWCCAE